MPLWHVYHPANTFNDYATKAALAKSITQIYTDVGLPAFYVNVYFHKIPGEDIWIGGVPQTAAPGSGDASLPRPFIRLVGENIAVNMGDDIARKERFTERAFTVRRILIITTSLPPHSPYCIHCGKDRSIGDGANAVLQYLKPHTEDKGYDWEFHVDETSKELWRIQGLRAPPVGSEPFKLWVKENKAIPWEKAPTGTSSA